MKKAPAYIFGFTDYREFLRAVHRARTGVNPRFGVRAFSRVLGVSPSMLSAILTGKRNLSLDRAEEIGHRLKLSASESEYFRLLVQLRRAKTEKLRGQILARMGPYRKRRAVRRVEAKDFGSFARWESMALLELASIGPIDSANRGPIGRDLGLSAKEMEKTLGRLRHLGLLIRDDDGADRRCPETVLIDGRYPDRVLRDYHRSFFARGLESLEIQPTDERYFASEMLPIPEKAVSLFRKRIEEFLDELHELAAEVGPGEKVYGLALGFFDLLTEGRIVGSPRSPA